MWRASRAAAGKRASGRRGVGGRAPGRAGECAARLQGRGGCGGRLDQRRGGLAVLGEEALGEFVPFEDAPVYATSGFWDIRPDAGFLYAEPSWNASAYYPASSGEAPGWAAASPTAQENDYFEDLRDLFPLHPLPAIF